jgi:prepilin-type N-terminal cleavage/methylation domain-containing protein
MKNSRGFTLVEVMVSMVLMAFAAIFSMLVIKVVAARQEEIRNMTQYTLVTKSIKSGFNEYVNSVDPATIPSGQLLLCANVGPLATEKDKMTTLICDMEKQLLPLNGGTKKIIDLTTNVTQVNGIYYFSGRVRVLHSSCPSSVCLDRVLVNQK